MNHSKSSRRVGPAALRRAGPPSNTAIADGGPALEASLSHPTGDFQQARPRSGERGYGSDAALGHSRLLCLLILVAMSALRILRAEEVGERWGTEEREREYYPIVNIPLPKDTVIEAGAFAVLPDRRIAVGTRHGEIYLIDGVDAAKPTPSFHRFATGLDEIFGLTWKDNAFRVTQSCELRY